MILATQNILLLLKGRIIERSSEAVVNERRRCETSQLSRRQRRPTRVKRRQRRRLVVDFDARPNGQTVDGEDNHSLLYLLSVKAHLKAAKHISQVSASNPAVPGSNLPPGCELINVTRK